MAAAEAVLLSPRIAAPEPPQHLMSVMSDLASLRLGLVNAWGDLQTDDPPPSLETPSLRRCPTDDEVAVPCAPAGPRYAEGGSKVEEEDLYGEDVGQEEGLSLCEEEASTAASFPGDEPTSFLAKSKSEGGNLIPRLQEVEDLFYQKAATLGTQGTGRPAPSAKRLPLSGSVGQAEGTSEDASSLKEPVTCQVACLSWAGTKNGFKKINQDSYSFMRTTDKKSLLFGIFDGHGPRGRDASQLVKDQLPKLLMARGQGLCEDTPSAFEGAFAQMQEELESQYEFDPGMSGTTAVMAHLHQRALSLAWAGDSRAVLGRRGEEGGISAVDLSVDHKPENKGERERIEAQGGSVYREVDECGDDVGPFRVWMKHGPMLGLAMSRSLGDSLAHIVGVSSKPEVRTVQLEQGDEFMVLASDGVWEFVSSEEAVGIVDSCPSPAIGAQKLMQHAKQQWLSKDIGSYVDDITAMVVAFKRNTE